MKAIELTQGKFALVNDEDFELLDKYSWSYASNGYAMGRVSGKVCLMHRFLLGKSKLDIDHINRNKLDNRRENLRFVTRSINCHNVGLDKGNKSGIKGVSWDKSRGKWRAGLKLNYKQVYHARFASKIEAEKAYRTAFLQFVGPIA